MQKMPGLIRANLVLVGMLVLHDLDHMRQGRSIAMPVIVLGLVGLITAIACLVLVLTGHRLAPHASVLIGTGNIVGFLAVHVLPRWSALSDPYPAVPVDAISWLNVGATILAAAAVGLIGLRAVVSKGAAAEA